MDVMNSIVPPLPRHEVEAAARIREEPAVPGCFSKVPNVVGCDVCFVFVALVVLVVALIHTSSSC